MSIVPGYVARLLDTGEDTEDAQASHRALIAGIKALVTWWKERYFRITGRGIAMRSWSECARVTNKMDMEVRFLYNSINYSVRMIKSVSFFLSFFFPPRQLAFKIV